jgi:hypothetical protein
MLEHREKTVRTQGESNHLQANVQDLGRNQTY